MSEFASCKNCGAPLDPSAKVCSACGQPVLSSSSPASTPDVSAESWSAQPTPQPKPTPDPTDRWGSPLPATKPAKVSPSSADTRSAFPVVIGDGQPRKKFGGKLVSIVVIALIVACACFATLAYLGYRAFAG